MTSSSPLDSTRDDIDDSAERIHRHLLDAMPSHALFALDENGNIAVWPTPARGLYGYAAGDILGKHLRTLLASNEALDDSVDALLSDATDGPVEDERWHETVEGATFWGSATVAPLAGESFGGYAVVVRDGTDEKQYERSLERQNDRLKEFTDILSHDLRNPIAVIAGRLDLYRETGESEHVTAIEETVERMERLVDDLLRVARQGRVVENPTPTDLESVLDIAREGTLPGDADLVHEPVPRVMADADRLRQLFENLLRNSVEHGGEAVTVRIGPLEDGFYVEDDGPGIPPDERERVFDHGFTTAPEGTGYGLSVVRSIAGAHGWDIAVTGADGGGARFEVTGVEFVSSEGES